MVILLFSLQSKEGNGKNLFPECGRSKIATAHRRENNVRLQESWAKPSRKEKGEKERGRPVSSPH